MRKQTRKKSAATRVLGWFGYGLFLLLALGAGTAYGWIHRSSFLTAMVSGAALRKPQEVFDGKDSLTVLLLGCDEDRYYRGTYAKGSNIKRKYARADMILVAKLDFKNNRITGVSIPRDTECTLPGYGRHKINWYHANAKKGEENELQEQAVEHILPGVDIQRVLVIDYEAFQDLVDTVGGVDVNVPKAMNYDDNAGNLHIHLKPGPQRLSGYDAMCYVRFRHDRESDFGRQNRQKEFLASFKSAVFRNALALPEIADKGRQVLNGALTNEEIMALAGFSRSVPTSKIAMGMVPVEEGRGTFLRVDEDKLPETLSRFGFVPGSGTRVTDRQ